MDFRLDVEPERDFRLTADGEAGKALSEVAGLDSVPTTGSSGSSDMTVPFEVLILFK